MGRSSLQTNQFVKTYNFSYSIDGIAFIDDYISNPLPGNVDNMNKAMNDFTSSSDSIIAGYSRFTPITWNEWPSMRIEATGRS